MRAVHIYATTGRRNSGDFFLGPSTKWRFESLIQEKVEWTNFNVRKVITEKDISFLNSFDYIVLGGGGLFLPDTNPNDVSCWQWAIPESLMRKLDKQIYVMSVGLNWFFEQDIRMPSRSSSKKSEARKDIFKKNIETLIDKSIHFSMRHKGDIKELNQFVELRNAKKIKFEFCPVIGYVEKNYKAEFKSGDYICFEIKDDRPNRRYLGTSKEKFYSELLTFIKHLKSKGEKIAVMSHDGSRSFASYLQKKGFKSFLYLDNTVSNQEKIINNYRKVKKLYCTAGHSQMTAHALGLDFYSLISHNKLKYFMEDTGRKSPEAGDFVKNITAKSLVENYNK